MLIRFPAVSVSTHNIALLQAEVFGEFVFACYVSQWEANNVLLSPLLGPLAILAEAKSLVLGISGQFAYSLKLAWKEAT